nr:peptidylprolyl isomerase [Evansella caseinilytica]
MRKKTMTLLLICFSVLLLATACGQGKEESADSSQGAAPDGEETPEEQPADDEETAEEPDKEQQPEREIAPDAYPQLSDEVAENESEAIIHTNMGSIHIKLFPEYAPKAVENFLTLSEDGYYDDVIFHRVIEDFMIQGGDPTGTGGGGESIYGEAFEDEFTTALAHFRGALSMANSGPNSNSSQFFIVHAGKEDLSNEWFEAVKEQYGIGFPEETQEHYLELGGTPHLDFSHTVFGQVIDGMDVLDNIARVETDAGDKPLEDVIIESVEVITK